MVPTYVLLTLAVFALWLGADPHSPAWRRYGWAFIYALAATTALATGILTWIGLGWIAALAAATAVFARGTNAPWTRRLAATLIVLLAAGLMTHQLPGFQNPRAIPPLQFTADATPFRLHLNFDKTAVGVLLLGLCHARVAGAAEWRALLAGVAPIAAAVIAVLMAAATVFGYVRFEPKFPDQSWLWLWVNLCFTCVAEEAVFRGFIQAQLQRAWRSIRHGTWLALVVASLLFGLAHFGGGAAYVALSTLAGLGYGWAYLRTGRIEASILTHFALNAVHFFGFTYPALQARA